MANRTKAIIATIIGVVVVCLAAIFILGKIGIINLGIFADVSPGGKTYNVTADPAQGEAYSSPVEKDASRIKVSAIAKNAGYTFLKWTSSSDSCKFVDKSKAATIAVVGENCTITANFKKTNLSSDHTGYEEICTAQDLEKVRNNLNGKFVQTCDIDMSGVDFEPIGKFTTSYLFTSYAMIDSATEIFRGVYDGNGKTISNLAIDDSNANVGLFRASTGTIKNVTLANVNILGGDDSAGGVVGKNLKDGTIENSIVKGKITGRVGTSQGVQSVGPLAAENEGTIQNSSSRVELNATNSTGSAPAQMLHYTGGLVGANYGGLIQNCYALGSINGFDSEVGGLVGYNRSDYKSSQPTELREGATAARISGSYANVDIKTPTGASNQRSCMIGGLIGYSQDANWVTRTTEIKSSFALGDITGRCKVGGLVGYAKGNHTVDSVYVQGNYIYGTASSIGGLIGELNNVSKNMTLSNCTANTKIKAENSAIGGLIGNLTDHVKIDTCKAISTIDVSFAQQAGSTATYPSRIGGFIGISSGTEIQSSKANFTINAPEAENVGGIIGQMFAGKILNSYAYGTITASDKASGFVDSWATGAHLGPKNNDTTPRKDTSGKSNWNDANTADYAIISSYANVTLKVSKENSAGFTREYFYTTNKFMVENCYWSKNRPGAATSSYGEGKTVNELKVKSTFVGWDFDNIWQISQPDGTGFPSLRK